jgi:PAS domain S-box-containing protein
MRIRTQFIVTMVLFGIILVVIAASAIVTSRLAEKAGEQEKIASNIAQGANELSYLSNDYLIYRESQQLKRWQTRFASFSSRVASLNVNKPEQQTLARNIQTNTQRLKEVFDSMVSAVRSSSRTQNVAVNSAFFQVSWSRMAVQSQGLVSDATRLSQLLLAEIDHLRQVRTMLMYVMVGLFGAFLFASYMLTYRRILKSMMALQAGTAVVGSGNLDFTIEEKKRDEIGDLSHAFNRMTSSLKEVTASKADLEREIVDRKRAEEDLRQQREWLRVTLSSIGDAVMAAGTDGRITFLNPVAMTLTGWQSQEALGQPIQGVFRIINERTRESAEDLVERVLNEKRAVALANDTVLITKDGREIPIEDSAAPILDAPGNMTGIVLVFHDVTERRHAQEALRKAHERAAWLARFPEQNPNPVMRASADGTVLYCNPATGEHPGWSCEVGQLLQNELLPLLRQAMAEEKELQWDIQIEGRFYFIWITPFPEERYANIYARDITERKRAEEALQESEERLRRAQEIAHLGSWELDLVNNRLTWSDEVYRIFGLQPQEFGATYGAFLEAVHPDDRAAVDAAYSGAVREGRDNYEIEHRVVRKSTAEIRSVHERCEHVRDESGRIIRSIGMVHDITERKRTEEELRQAEEKSRLLIKYAPSMFYEIDFHRLAFKSVNDLMCQFLGYTREELLVMSPFDLLDEEGKALFRERIRRKLAGEDINDSVEYKSRTKDGREVYGVLNITFTYKDGKPEGAVVVAHDITERKRAEQALKQRSSELQKLAETLEQRVKERTEELEEANKALRQLSIRLLSAQEEERKRVAGELHDTIGSCLSGIKFKVESALEEIAKTPKAATESLSTIVPVIQEAVEECRRIQMDLRPSMLDDLGLLPTLSWFFRRFQTLYSTIRIEQELRIEETELPDSLKIVIYRVIQEAMNNAAKHSKADLVRISLWKVHDKMELFVVDNGCGFSVQQRLFLDNSRRGLGLTSMRERTELSGGSFAVESAEGNGTMIRALWPI